MTELQHDLAAKWQVEAQSSASNALDCDDEEHRARLEAEAETLTACAAELRAALAAPKIVQIAATYDHGCHGGYEPGDVLYALRSDGTMWAMYRAAASDRRPWVAIPEPPR